MFKKLFLTGVAGLILLVCLGFLNWTHPAFDTISHFRLHLSAGLMVCTVLLTGFGKFRFAVVTLSAAAIGIWFAADGTRLTERTIQAAEGKPVYTMFHFNLLWLNRKKQHVINRILEIDPDIISLSEASTQWKPALRKLESRWKFNAHCPEWHVRGGVRIYSRWPLDHSEDFCGEYGSFLRTKAVLGNKERITVGSVHTRWPWPASGPRQVENLVPEIAKTGPDALITGDFNATTWSWSVQRFAAAGNLRIHSGIGGTWIFGALPKPVVNTIGLPIDNVMTKGRIRVLSVKTLEEMGSDHLPLLVSFQVQ
ncbi:MAG: endonuclease/exonuclease/phosphatase family protein [Pseudomonadota bacterium]